MLSRINHSLIIALIWCIPVTELSADLKAKCLALNPALYADITYFRGRCFANTQTAANFHETSECTALPNGRAAIINSVQLRDALAVSFTADVSQSSDLTHIIKAKILLRSLGHGNGGGSWVATVRQTPSTAVTPNPGNDDGWYFKYNGQFYGPLPLKSQGWAGHWQSWGPDELGVSCTIFQVIATNIGGLEDRPCTQMLWTMCEYHDNNSERNFKQLAALNNQRVISNFMFHNLTVPHLLRCTKECAEHWLCASFGYHPITKDCRLALIYEHEDAALYEAASGYQFFTYDD